MYKASENDEILIIAIGFYTNEPNYMNHLNVTYTQTQYEVCK